MSLLQRPIARAVVVAVVLAGALAGCTASTTPTTNGGTVDCGGKVAEVLLGDDSVHQVVSFDPGDSPKIFGLPAAPVPSCAYRGTVERQQGAGQTTVTHRSYLYIGISDADAKKVVAALVAAGGAAPWSHAFSNVPATPPPTPVPSLSQTQEWDYNITAPATADRGSMSYTLVAPVNPGIAVQAGLAGSPDVLRVETEIRTPKK